MIKHNVYPYIYRERVLSPSLIALDLDPLAPACRVAMNEPRNSGSGAAPSSGDEASVHITDAHTETKIRGLLSKPIE